MSARGTQSQSKSIAALSLAEAATVLGAQGQRLIPGITGETCAAEHLSAGLVVMPPGKVAKPHLHARCESLIFFLEGWFATLKGQDLEPIFHGPGDLMFVPDGAIHVGINLSADRRAVALEVRSDPSFTEDVTVLFELEELVAEIAAELQQKFADGALPLPADWEERGFGPYEFVDKG